MTDLLLIGIFTALLLQLWETSATVRYVRKQAKRKQAKIQQFRARGK